MKKIGIITLNGNNNYGNRLQNYALRKVLTDLNMDVYTIWFLKDNKFFLKDFIKKIMFFSLKYARYNNFKKFSHRYLKIKYYTNKDIESLYDYFVVGSDQVWNWTIYNDFETYLLTFSPKNKNIAYAASFGVSNVKDEYQKLFCNGLKNIKDISVREDNGKNLVKEISGLDAEVVLDPTMLLTAKEWDRVSKKPKMLKTRKYILNYFLGNLSETNKKEINRVAYENNCEIINILDKNSPYYKCGPSEFLYLEKNAFLICTDSFHSSVFAIIYDRPFIIFEREDKMEKMNSRIDTLISKFNLKDRIYNGHGITYENLHHNYSDSYKILEQEREKSMMFLKNALNIQDCE